VQQGRRQARIVVCIDIQEATMTTQDAKDNRSEALLPTDPDGAQDDQGAPEVAEEVAFDQQSARVRGLGNFPKDGASTAEDKAVNAVAATLEGGGDAKP
jgi:hypothetical protein